METEDARAAPCPNIGASASGVYQISLQRFKPSKWKSRNISFLWPEITVPEFEARGSE